MVNVYIRARQEDGTGRTALRAAMDAAGIGCHRLERVTGINHQHIYKVAKGQGGMERRLAARIADALGVPVVELFTAGDVTVPEGS